MEKPVPDRELTAEEKELVKVLTEEQVKEIDEMLLSHVHPKRSRKVAFIVGSTIMDLPNRVKGNQHESTSLGEQPLGLVMDGCGGACGSEYNRGNRMRENRTSGTVVGAPGNGRPYVGC